jgi:signal peptidase I
MTIELITRYVKILIGFVLVWGGIWVFNNYGCSRVEGPEMTPTIPADKSVGIDTKVHTPDQLTRDDVIMYTYDVGGKGSARKVTARVIGLPGDRVKIVKGEVYLNNEKLGGSSDKKTAEDYSEIIVPRNTVYALCDNRSTTKTLDSRTIGPIGSWAIVGRLR